VHRGSESEIIPLQQRFTGPQRSSEENRDTGKPARRFKDFSWTTRTNWSRSSRVVAKAEVSHGDHNPRFIVTSPAQEEWSAQPLYEQLHCARGGMENRIKECQLDLFADRTLAASLRANQRLQVPLVLGHRGSPLVRVRNPNLSEVRRWPPAKLTGRYSAIGERAAG
jgi:hypothetical protein